MCIRDSAAQHDGARLREGLVQTANTGRRVWADTAYRSAENEAWPAGAGMVSEINRKKPRARPMSKPASKANGRKLIVARRSNTSSGTRRIAWRSSFGRFGPRQGDHHSREHGLQYGPIEMAAQPSCARLNSRAAREGAVHQRPERAKISNLT